jgi:hypothetical protein
MIIKIRCLSLFFTISLLPFLLLSFLNVEAIVITGYGIGEINCDILRVLYPSTILFAGIGDPGTNALDGSYGLVINNTLASSGGITNITSFDKLSKAFILDYSGTSNFCPDGHGSKTPTVDLTISGVCSNEVPIKINSKIFNGVLSGNVTCID